MRLILAFLALALAAVVLLLSRGDSPETPHSAAMATPDEASQPRQGSADATTDVDPTLRVDAATPDALVEHPTAAIRGRLVDAQSGAAITDGIVRLIPSLAGDYRVARYHGDLPTAEPRTARTDLHGAFELTFAPHQVFRYELAVEAPGCVLAAARWPELDAGIELGDVPLRRARLLAGRLVDTDGVPVSGVEIGIAHRSDGVPDVDWEPPLVALLTTTLADGGFAFSTPLPPDWLRWHVATPGFEVFRPSALGGDGTAQDAVVRRLTDRIDGTVTGTDGRPAAGVFVQVRTPAARVMARTDDRGAFAACRGTFAGAIEDVAVIDHELVDPPPDVTWGDLDVHLRVRARGGLRLRVTDERAEPLVRYRVIVRLESGSVPRRWSRPIGGRHPDGVAELSGLPPGRHQLLVAPGGAVPAGPFAFEVPDGDTNSLEITVGAAQRLAVAVVDASGAPVEGASISLAVPDGYGKVPPRVAPTATDRAFQDGAAMRLAAARTNARGRASLRAPAELDGVFLHVGETVAGFAAPVATLPIDTDGTRRVVLPRAAELHVTVRDAAVLQERLGPDLELYVSQHRPGNTSYVGLAPVRDGRAALLDGHAGHFELHLAWRAPHGPLRFWPDASSMVEIVPGRCEATIDAATVRPSRVFGTIKTPPPTGTRIRSLAVLRLNAHGDTWFTVHSVLVGVDGSFDARGLLSGTFRLQTPLLGKIVWQPQVTLLESLALAPGEEIEVELQFPKR